MTSPTPHPFIKGFADITIDDVPLVGGKNASLGTMVRELASQGVNVPNGFSITVPADVSDPQQVRVMFERTVAEFGRLDIRVNSIAPGAIRTTINTAAWSTREAYDALLPLIPQKRIGEPEEISRAAVWLASDQSDYVHGITLFVDGGMTLYPGFETGG